MSKEEYLKLAEEFIDSMEKAVVGKTEFMPEERKAVLEFLDKNYEERDNFAGIRIRTDDEKRQSGLGDLTVTLITKNEAGELTSQTNHLNYKNGQFKTKNAGIKDQAMFSNMEKAITRQFEAFEKARVRTPEAPVQGDAVKEVFHIREHLSPDDVAKLDALPEKQMQAIEEKLNGIQSAHPNDEFKLYVSENEKGGVNVDVRAAQCPSIQVMQVSASEKEMTVQNYPSWKNDLQQEVKAQESIAKNATKIQGLDGEEMDKDSKEMLKGLIREVMSEEVPSAIPGEEGKPLTKEDIDNNNRFNAHLDGLKLQMDAVLKDFVVNGGSPTQAQEYRAVFDKLTGEIQAEAGAQERSDATMQGSKKAIVEPLQEAFEELKQNTHETYNRVKEFGSKMLSESKDEVQYAITKHLVNRETAAELDTEKMRQRDRQFMAYEYGAEKDMADKARAQLAKAQAKFNKKARRKDNSIFNFRKQKHDLTPEQKATLRALQKEINIHETNATRIQESYRDSIRESVDRLSEIKSQRSDIGLEGKSKDKKLDKAIENVKNDRGLDDERSR